MGFTELRAIHHDHDYVRQSLALIQAALSCHAAPPEGHAYWCILRDAASYLAQDMPGHMAAEEAQVYTLYAALPGAECLDGLRAEHRELAVLAASLHAAVGPGADGEPERRWVTACARARLLADRLAAHMDAEEALLRKLDRGDRPDDLRTPAG